VNHSLAKATLFLVSGNILARYGTKSTSQVRGVLRALPATGTLWLLGFFAIAGSPPFGTFLGELQILRGAIDQGRIAVAVAYLASLAVAFAGMLALVLGMALGQPPEGKLRPSSEGESIWTVLPPTVLIGLVLLLGLWVPLGVWDSVDAAARILGGR
jgi:hydrogenase-4 component F